jgi:hypothetical protein
MNEETLTKREYFAGRAMQGLLANASESLVGLTVQATADIAVEAADALLLSLEGLTTEPVAAADKHDDEFSNRALE